MDTENPGTTRKRPRLWDPKLHNPLLDSDSDSDSDLDSAVEPTTGQDENRVSPTNGEEMQDTENALPTSNIPPLTNLDGEEDDEEENPENSTTYTQENTKSRFSPDIDVWENQEEDDSPKTPKKNSSEDGTTFSSDKSSETPTEGQVLPTAHTDTPHPRVLTRRSTAVDPTHDTEERTITQPHTIIELPTYYTQLGSTLTLPGSSTGEAPTNSTQQGSTLLLPGLITEEGADFITDRDETPASGLVDYFSD